jgi:flavin reductase (DIM6/NTAB) family NADH-FMN oxidoreductase RutF
MECKVVARMEANDHWVVYSEVGCFTSLPRSI